jgi:aspartate aminotransferase
MGADDGGTSMSGAVSRLVGQQLEALGPFLQFMTGSVWAKRRFAPEACDFVIGNPHDPVVPGLAEALARWSEPRAKDWFAYKVSEPEAQQLVAASLRQRTGVVFEPDDVALTNGAFAGLAVAIRAVCDAGDEVIYNSPPWFFYETIIRGCNATPVRVTIRPDDFDLDLDAIAAAITPRTRAIIVNSPHNPTRKIYPEETLRRLANLLTAASAQNGHRIYLLSDEAYCRIVYDGRVCPTPTAFYPWSFLIYTYGKTLLTPGERLGYIALPPAMPERETMRFGVIMAQVMTGYAFPNALLQHALSDLEPLSIDVRRLQARRDRMVAALRAAGYQAVEPEGTFYVLTRSPEADDRAFAERLAGRDVFVLPGALFEMPGWFRISLTANDEMIERALPVFAAVMAEVSAEREAAAVAAV